MLVKHKALRYWRLASTPADACGSKLRHGNWLLGTRLCSQDLFADLFQISIQSQLKGSVDYDSVHVCDWFQPESN